MKTLLTLIALFASALSNSAQTPALLWETPGFIGPESVVFDSTRHEFFVSNMGTYGKDATPGDGFISRVSAEGKILARYAPTDGVGNFNDCTADPDGNVYVCSGRLDTVFCLHAGKFEAWYKIDKARTGGLNGLKAEKNRLLLGGWSVHDAAGVEQLGHISTVAYADHALSRLGTQPICHIDGLEPDGNGGYTATDWLTGDIMHVTADGKPTLIMKLVQGSADHTYLIDQQLLIIPLMKNNVLRAYRWSPPAAK